MEKNISIEIYNAKSASKPGFMLNEISPNDTIIFLKERISAIKHLSVDRISIRLEPRGKNLGDEQMVSQLNLPSSNPQLYYRDLGPQIPWKTVFLFEYAGPLFIYPIFYMRPSFIYGAEAASTSTGCVATIALICHSLHYAKRLYETQFVHRFSNGTMPIRNLFKNCSYYWGFSSFLAYSINHPLFTSPGKIQVFIALCCFIVSEIGNFSIHTLLRDLRPPGSKERKIPYPNSNPLTAMYNFVSCPNYTYEVASWISFTVMTQCLPAALFTLAGFLQMKQWANGKHRNYKKEFPNYPKNRTPIVPFIYIAMEIDDVSKKSKEGEKGYANTRILPKQGRWWKKAQPSKPAVGIMKSTKSAWEKKMKEKSMKIQVHKLQDEIRQKLSEEKALKLEAKKEKEKRRKENMQKSEVLQVIKNPAKLKRMKKKQLKMIQKRDINP